MITRATTPERPPDPLDSLDSQPEAAATLSADRAARGTPDAQDLAPLVVGPVTLGLPQPAIMGILNVTPDSFSDGGQLQTVEAAVARAHLLVAQGAVIVDVGGESTRPGAAPVEERVELERVIPVVERLRASQLAAAISVDTSKSGVARAALRAGAHMVNDISALRDAAMATVVAQFDAALVLMHMRGDPRTMQHGDQHGDIHYDDVTQEVRACLARAIARATAGGVAARRILIDPGIGFGKTTAHNLTLTRQLKMLASLGHLVVYGPSRKRFLGELTGRPVEQREAATAAACVAAVLAGAHIVRVHEPAAVRDALLVAAALRDAA